ncbi:MAG: LLM class F420-dependent oxidoreductase [Deltaproteobacteria bacterium]|nr:MAG: LLM class F420-dependent oxidoreductase [Deltaproteobacteria bacterium]
MKFVCSLAFSDPTDCVELARTADECGWDAIVVSDHVVHPERIDTPYPYTPDGKPRWEAPTPWPDPWVVIGAMAAVTQRLRFITGIYVLPMRNPFAAAKAIGTAAVISGDRVTLGIGAGWMSEEFERMEQPFERRGARMDEMVEVMRKLWTGEMAEHHGRFYDFDRLQMSPAVNETIPIYTGGLSKPALRRVGRLADGWFSDLHTTDELREIIGTLREMRTEYGREDVPLDVVASCRDAFDLDGYKRLEEIGVTHLQTMPWVFYGSAGDSLEQKRDGLRRFADDVIAKMEG